MRLDRAASLGFHFREALGSIHMKQRWVSGSAHQRSRDRLNDARLIVDVHKGDEQGVVSDFSTDLLPQNAPRDQTAPPTPNPSDARFASGSNTALFGRAGGIVIRQTASCIRRSQ